jgi:hypothetical protein
MPMSGVLEQFSHTDVKGAELGDTLMRDAFINCLKFAGARQ